MGGAYAVPALADPTGGVVISGQVNIGSQGNVTTIQQALIPR